MRIILGTSVGLLLFTVGCEGSAIIGGDDDDAVVDDDDDAAGPTCDDALVRFEFTEGREGFDDEAPDEDFSNPWEFGRPAERGCATGERCWATDLQGDYGDCNSGRLVGPTLDLSACAAEGRAVTLSFQHVYGFEAPSGEGRYWDGGLVQLRGDDGEWQDVDPRPDYDGELDGNVSECAGTYAANGHDAWSGPMDGDDWSEVEIAVDPELLTESMQFSFLFGSDRAATAEGWYIDDVAVSAD